MALFLEPRWPLTVAIAHPKNFVWRSLVISNRTSSEVNE